GLDMLRLLSLSQILDALHIQPSRWFNFDVRPHAILGGAFTLGVVTYFLPCGFTISTQAFALSTGNPVLSSQIMTAFALGTIPSLIFIAALSHVRSNALYQYFLKVVGVIIFVVGCSYVWSTLTLNGFSLFSNTVDNEFAGEVAQMQDGVQVVKMTATSSGYNPSKFIVQNNIPVRWEIDGKEIYGCQGTLQSPQAGIQLTNLKEGENVFEFTPKETGYINFSCSMGMFSGQFKVVEG
nr:sulfite exporter TauE/SafE family protein [Candidatus Woesebacteria bacterium]